MDKVKDNELHAFGLCASKGPGAMICFLEEEQARKILFRIMWPIVFKLLLLSTFNLVALSVLIIFIVTGQTQ